MGSPGADVAAGGRSPGRPPQGGRPLALAYSPCPNDTYIFHGWVHGLVPGAPPVREILEDIDRLNERALRQGADVVKVSFAALAGLREHYALLHSGGALGRGVGPLLVARKDSELRAAPANHENAALADRLSRARIAIPGELTTAALLLRLFLAVPSETVVMPFDQIMPSVVAGRVDGGVIIHEGRFTFASFGLRCLLDLGEWWESATGLPLPLGGILVKRSLGRTVAAAVDHAIRASLECAIRDPETTRAYVVSHAQEMDPKVCDEHIALYVNDFSLDYGSEGERAIRELFHRAADVHLADSLSDGGLFWDDERS
jgi:1,4-dihydroxy-6-naphthoate synthase